MAIEKIKGFLQEESASGILLMIAAVLAIIAENSFVSQYYSAFLQTPVEIRIGAFKIAKPLLLWVNDGLMAIFFFLIGLEVKREFLAGEFSDLARVTLPVIAAIGGMLVPALIFIAINWGNPIAMKGWAIPSATDIAFALGVLALLGSRVPQSLKLFLMTLAIIDDLGAIIIIALFYTADLSVNSLLVALGAIICLFVLNRRGVLSLAPYLLIGVIMWAAVLKSGIHATLAGVITAFFIPFKKEPGENITQLERIEQDINPAVAYGILPLFAFTNSGVSFTGVTVGSLFDLLPAGIAAGLFFGKQIGVFVFSWLAIKTGISKLPEEMTFRQLYGVSALCGIGFTMSLFIGALAFEHEGPAYAVDVRLGILIGSLLAGILGYLILRFQKAAGNR